MKPNNFRLIKLKSLIHKEDKEIAYTENIYFKSEAGPEIEIGMDHTDENPGRVVKPEKVSKMHFQKLQTRRDAMHVNAFRNPIDYGIHEVKTTVDSMTPEEISKTEITKFRIETETGRRTIKFRLL